MCFVSFFFFFSFFSPRNIWGSFFRKWIWILWRVGQRAAVRSRGSLSGLFPKSLNKHINLFPTFHSNNIFGCLKVFETLPCKYYNRGGCKNGGRCTYLHVCKFFQAGKCKYGQNCKLNHSADGRASSGRSRTQDGTTTSSKEILFSTLWPV